MKYLIALCIISLLFSCAKDASVEAKKHKTMMIKSIGEVETMPDMATFYIQLNCLDMSIKGSKNCLVEKSNELNSRLRSFGIAEEDILTTSVNMNRSYTWRNNSRVFEGYKSSTSTFVTIKNLDNLDVIYTELLENRNLDLGGLGYTHSRIDSLQNEAYVNALKKAEILSERLLERLPETEKEILKIGNVEISASLPEVNDSRMDVESNIEQAQAANYNSIAISKGTVKMRATLFVEYQIR